MLFMQNKKTPAGLTILIFFLLSLAYQLYADEEPTLLTIIPYPGMLVLDADTLELKSTETLEIASGEHLLKFFPYHTVEYWAHRYLVYPFTIGSSGRKTIDLSMNGLFTIRSDPQSADLIYRGRFLGRTPGEYFLLVGTGDSLIVSLDGYQKQTVYIDDFYNRDIKELYCNLEKLKADEFYGEDDLLAYKSSSPLKKLLSPDLIASLGTGAALFVVGSHFNREADRYYDRYLRLLETKAREDAFSQARRNDRLSKASFIGGDLALGVFGYILIRRYMFPPETGDRAKKTSRLSLKITQHKAEMAFKF